VARDDRLDEPLLDGEWLTEGIVTLRAALQFDLLGGIDPQRRWAVVRLVTVPSAPLTALLFGSIQSIGLGPLRRRGDAGAELGELGLEGAKLPLPSIIALEVGLPFLLGEGDRSHVSAFAHAERGSASRLKYCRL
jgi:hypothetical protein